MRLEHGLLMILLGANWGLSGNGAELPKATQAVEPIALTTPAELEALTLSMFDEKLALSLAVEAHVQIELLQFAVAELDDAHLKSLAEKRWALHRGLFAALDDLTAGRAANMLSAAAASNAATAEVRTAATKTAETTTAIDSAVESRQVAEVRPARKPANRAKRGGLKAAVENATNAAVMRVRLDVAGEYADLLRSELESAESAEFDRAYSTLDVVNQMQVVALLRVFERQASDDFAAIIHRATSLAESHLGEARQLAQDSDEPVVDPMVAVSHK
jgi:hypothetical protein